jgi:hypothetical protein
MFGLLVLFLIFSCQAYAEYGEHVVLQHESQFQPRPLISVNDPTSSAPFYIQIAAHSYYDYIPSSLYKLPVQENKPDKRKQRLSFLQKAGQKLGKVADTISDGFDWISGEHRHRHHRHRKPQISQQVPQQTIQKPKEISTLQAQRNQPSQSLCEKEVQIFYSPVINECYRRRNQAIKSVAENSICQNKQFIFV